MSNWVVSSTESVVKQQISLLDHLIIDGIDTSLFQFACLDQFINFIGFKVVSLNKVWHIIDTRKGSLRKYMSLEDAVSLYNITPLEHIDSLIDLYNIDEGILQDFHFHIKTIAMVKLKRYKGHIITTNNFVKFIDKD